MAATGELLLMMADSDSAGVSALVPDLTSSADRAWQTHLSLFPVAQRVQNPPYINPHLPKMYRIYREFLPYLAAGDVPALVRLEINEYTQRPKLGKMPKPPRSTSAVSFLEIASSIGAQEPERVAALLDAFTAQQGQAELARNLLLLGSGYLEQSLGHSVSCTAFILLEMLDRPEQDSWP
ncbi:MAG: hypothetical protein HYX90_02370, partial [Chloroflexi bacterium]|nr:hypothetical protein [Chloroflexota bacterium]